MNRREWMEYIAGTYGAEAEYPWADDDTSAVFRHRENRKWFALVMQVRRDKLGLAGEGMLDVMNVKCDPMLAATLWGGVRLFQGVSHEQDALADRRFGRQCGRADGKIGARDEFRPHGAQAAPRRIGSLRRTNRPAADKAGLADVPQALDFFYLYL